MWLFILFSLALSTLVIVFLRRVNNSSMLPPGPLAVPIIGNLLWLRRNHHRDTDLAHVLRHLHAKYGPIVTLYIGSKPAIFIADRSIAHQALVERGTVFSTRPTTGSAEHKISTGAYGPTWRRLRRNLASEILHPSRVKLYAGGRAWVLGLLVRHLRSEADGGVVVALRGFQFAMFCLLVFMCFGEKLDEMAVRDIDDVQRRHLLFFDKLDVLAFAPSISKYIFRNRLRTVMAIKERQRQLFLPLIDARRGYKQTATTASNEEERFVYSYVDSLLNVELPEEEGRKLSDDEIVTLCSEFLIGGTDATSTALQWIIANLVKHQDVQAKLREEIDSEVVGDDEEIREEDLQKMPYLMAVIMEGLRLHPPSHFVLPHAVTEDVSLCGYRIPKEATINFFVAEMNRDGKVWEEPMEFKPERFVRGAAVDVTGSREIKMMTFGAGRRICPGLGLAMLHLEYFVANLVREFEWKAVEGEEVDMAEKDAFTVTMKNPLRARIVTRKKIKIY